MFDALEMKARAGRGELAKSGLLAVWEDKRRAFLERLGNAQIGALILDYDGTVYAGGQLHNAQPDKDMISLLVKQLENGLALGFASGRGASLGDALRQAFEPAFWPRIYVAYQDGAEIGILSDDSLPTPYSPSLENPALAFARQKLAALFNLWPWPPCMRCENNLLGLRCEPQTIEAVFSASCETALPLGLKVFRSGRMVDIVPQNVGKRNLEDLCALPGKATLALGDAGAWPGNDWELLDSPFGVSVGSVSANPERCWRITQEDGVAATRKILKAIRGDKLLVDEFI